MQKLKKELIRHSRFYAAMILFIIMNMVLFTKAIGTSDTSKVAVGTIDQRIKFIEAKINRLEDLQEKYPIYASDFDVFQESSEINKQLEKYLDDPESLRGTDGENMPIRCYRLKNEANVDKLTIATINALNKALSACSQALDLIEKTKDLQEGIKIKYPNISDKLIRRIKQDSALKKYKVSTK